MKRYSLLMIVLLTVGLAPVFAESENLVVEPTAAESAVAVESQSAALPDEATVLPSPQDDALFTVHNELPGDLPEDLDLNDDQAMNDFFAEEPVESAAQ